MVCKKREMKMLPAELVRLLSCYPKVNKPSARASRVSSESETRWVGLKLKRV
jgi:hypothetical protein